MFSGLGLGFAVLGFRGLGQVSPGRPYLQGLDGLRLSGLSFNSGLEFQFLGLVVGFRVRSSEGVELLQEGLGFRICKRLNRVLQGPLDGMGVLSFAV